MSGNPNPIGVDFPNMEFVSKIHGTITLESPEGTSTFSGPKAEAYFQGASRDERYTYFVSVIRADRKRDLGGDGEREKGK